MTEQRLEDRPGQLTLAMAEAEYQHGLELIGEAREQLRVRFERGEYDNIADYMAARKLLDDAWRSVRAERDRVAEQNRKDGIAVAGDLDLAAARAEVCERLDRIAAALAAG